MDWEYVRIWGLILGLVALGAALAWGLGFAVYLNRIGSRGWASTRRMLKSSAVVFSLALPLAIAAKEGPTLWTLVRGRCGSAEGQFQTGLLYQEGGTLLRLSPARAVANFRRAADQGHTQAQVALARACYYGRGTARDNPEALRWARAAAQAGHPLAMVLAGEILRTASPQEAEPFFRKAEPLLQADGKQGDAEASFALGHLYRHGLGVAQDPVEALAWLRVARLQGISPVQAYAVQRYAEGLSPEQQAQARIRAEDLMKIWKKP